MLEPKKPDDPIGTEGAKLDPNSEKPTKPSGETDGQEGTSTSDSDLKK